MLRHWTLGTMLTGLILFSSSSYAIPAFSRQYQTSCATCHVAFPKLNDFGKAFKDAGFKFPKDDESFLKIPAVLLGAPAQKELWPRTIWPGQIPGIPPIGLRMNNFFQLISANRGNFDQTSAPGTVNPFIPRTDFETGFFSIFTAGNFGSDIAFWVDDDISVAGNNANGGLGDGYLKFVNIGRFLRLPTDALHLRVGRFELDLPFTQARSYNISPYDIYTQANIGAMNALFPQHNINNAFTFADVANGIEFSGGHQYGGYHYSLAIVDQNSSGLDQGSNTSSFVPSATGGSNGGLGFASDSNFKDLYGRLAYRFNLERDPASRHEVQAAGTTGPRDHTYLTLGTYGFYGRSVQRFSGLLSDGVTPTVVAAREPFYRVGGDFTFNYRALQIYGLYMYGRDHNLLPIDDTGALIPLPLTPTSALPVAFIRNAPATFGGGFIQADYLVFPWVLAIMRYDAVNSHADQINGLAFATNTPFFAPLHVTRDRFTPGVQFLIHANIKASFEYQIRPRQFVLTSTNPITGLPAPAQSFRTNAATAGLEFVY